ncbi:CPBP family glutamic-type intramembrane protease [Myxococcota bacterium]|nr:CPBP family glutamic-type intramembrane protease [Myxococcota bacterium]
MNAADQPPEPAPPRDVLVREVLFASVGILAALALVKHLRPVVPLVAEHAFTIAAGLQLYVPILLIGKRGITRESLGASLARWREDLALVAVLAIATTIPYAIGHHVWQTEVFHRPFHLRLPDDLLTSVLLQVFVVALAEEMFFRGYLQERMERLWPAKRRLFGAPFGVAIVASSAVFALAHFVGEYDPSRLGPFFPSLVFGLLRARTGTIVGAIGYHAFSNILAEVLWASYHSKP